MLLYGLIPALVSRDLLSLLSKRQPYKPWEVLQKDDSIGQVVWAPHKGKIPLIDYYHMMYILANAMYLVDLAISNQISQTHHTG